MEDHKARRVLLRRLDVLSTTLQNLPNHHPPSQTNRPSNANESHVTLSVEPGLQTFQFRVFDFTADALDIC
jgi:hypothetical protein